MLYEELRNASKVVIGTKQTIRALRDEDVFVIYMADDIDESVREMIFEAVGDQDVNLVYVESKEDLGQECGIDVPCACAAVLR